MTENTSDLKSYIRNIDHGAMIAAIIFLGFGLCGLIFGGDSSGFALFPLALGIGWLLKWYFGFNRASKCINELISDGSITSVLSDFQNGKHCLNDNIIVGENYLIGKKSSCVLSYSEITRLYQFVHKTNFVEDQRKLQAVTTSGKTYSLARLELKGRSNEELNTLLVEILSRNAAIKVG